MWTRRGIRGYLLWKGGIEAGLEVDLPVVWIEGDGCHCCVRCWSACLLGAVDAIDSIFGER